MIFLVSKRPAALWLTVIPNVKNPPKHKFAQGDFTSFSMEVSANSHNFRFRANLCGISGLWDIFILHSYCFGFTNFSRCLFLLHFEDVPKTWMYKLYIQVFETSSFLPWNQWRSMGPALVSRIFFRCSIFNCYNISICKKKRSKMRHLKNLWNQWRSN